MAKPILTTSKMPKETEQQYTAWLLYCEAGSIQKTLRVWNKLGQDWGEIGVEFAGRLGKKPSESSLENWSKKYRWVDRAELKLVDELEALREKTKKINVARKHKIAEAFGRVTDKILKRLRSSEEPTIDEWKKIWEMLRTEMGETLGKHTVGIDESQQTPPNEEEKELGRLLNGTAKQFYVQRAREKQQSKHHHLDRKQGNKD